jgi:hypothetical protein
MKIKNYFVVVFAFVAAVSVEEKVLGLGCGSRVGSSYTNPCLTVSGK